MTKLLQRKIFIIFTVLFLAHCGGSKPAASGGGEKKDSGAKAATKGTTPGEEDKNKGKKPPEGAGATGNGKDVKEGQENAGKGEPEKKGAAEKADTSTTPGPVASADNGIFFAPTPGIIKASSDYRPGMIEIPGQETEPKETLINEDTPAEASPTDVPGPVRSKVAVANDPTNAGGATPEETPEEKKARLQDEADEAKEKAAAEKQNAADAELETLAGVTSNPYNANAVLLRTFTSYDKTAGRSDKAFLKEKDELLQLIASEGIDAEQRQTIFNRYLKIIENEDPALLKQLSVDQRLLDLFNLFAKNEAFRIALVNKHPYFKRDIPYEITPEEIEMASLLEYAFELTTKIGKQKKKTSADGFDIYDFKSADQSYGVMILGRIGFAKQKGELTQEDLESVEKIKSVIGAMRASALPWSDTPLDVVGHLEKTEVPQTELAEQNAELVYDALASVLGDDADYIGDTAFIPSKTDSDSSKNRRVEITVRRKNALQPKKPLGAGLASSPATSTTNTPTTPTTGTGATPANDTPTTSAEQPTTEAAAPNTATPTGTPLPEYLRRPAETTTPPVNEPVWDVTKITSLPIFEKAEPATPTGPIVQIPMRMPESATTPTEQPTSQIDLGKEVVLNSPVSEPAKTDSVVTAPAVVTTPATVPATPAATVAPATASPSTSTARAGEHLESKLDTIPNEDVSKLPEFKKAGEKAPVKAAPAKPVEKPVTRTTDVSVKTEMIKTKVPESTLPAKKPNPGPVVTIPAKPVTSQPDTLLAKPVVTLPDTLAGKTKVLAPDATVIAPAKPVVVPTPAVELPALNDRLTTLSAELEDAQDEDMTLAKIGEINKYLFEKENLSGMREERIEQINQRLSEFFILAKKSDKFRASLEKTAKKYTPAEAKIIGPLMEAFRLEAALSGFRKLDEDIINVHQNKETKTSMITISSTAFTSDQSWEKRDNLAYNTSIQQLDSFRRVWNILSRSPFQVSSSYAQIMTIVGPNSKEDFKKIGEMVRKELLTRDAKESVTSSLYTDNMMRVIKFPDQLYELKDKTQRVEILITTVQN
jgi:hypothetical protein